jgi:protein-tyrosine-phosphatase
MNIEVNDIEGRAARHAALSDSVRLRIVDTLCLGDVAPVELQRDLGIASNLLAHHLAVLERAGLVTKHRSEADRRRSYLRLRDGAFDGLLPVPALTANRVVFVCTGNSARSQFAAALWSQASALPVASAGTHPADRIAPGALATARRHGLELRDTPRNLTDVAVSGDLIVTVCDAAHEELGGADRLHWSIPDPVADGHKAAFEVAFTDIAARITDLAPHLTAPAS